MSRSLRALIFCAALMAAAANAGAGADAGDSEKFPVRWSASLGLQSLDDIERRQRQPLWSAAGIVLAHKWRYSGIGNAHEPVGPRRLVSCAYYWGADHRLYKTASESDHFLLADFAATCVALKALKLARPARQSFIAELRLDETAADALPAMLDIAVNPAERDEIEQAGAKGLSWRQSRASQGAVLISVRRKHDSAALFEWTRGKSLVEFLARGDFNGDGIEDLLLHISQWPGYGHGAKVKALLVTRYRRGAVMQVLAWPLAKHLS